MSQTKSQKSWFNTDLLLWYKLKKGGGDINYIHHVDFQSDKTTEITIFFYLKLTRTTTDAKWWQKLRWPFGPGELKYILSPTFFNLYNLKKVGEALLFWCRLEIQHGCQGTMCSNWLKIWRSSYQNLLSPWNCYIIEMMTGLSSAKFAQGTFK
jgi:hypothetical protein